jgi:signal transduction histidine kinase/HAMP domain-containing protein
VTVRKRLRITLFAVIAVSLMSLLVPFFAWRSTIASVEESSRFAAIAREVSQLDRLTDDYISRSSERALEQWEQGYDSLGILFAELQTSDEREEADFATAKEDYQELGIYFSRLIEARNGSLEQTSASVSSTADLQVEKLHSLISLKLTALSSEAFALAEESQSRTIAGARWGPPIISAAIFMLLAFGIAVLLTTSSRFNKSVQGLRECAVSLSRGNLEERVNISGTDEFADLATAFNAMADHIEEDMGERAKAEEIRLRLNRELRAIGECNQALLRAVDEKSLLSEVCDIIVRVAGYDLAWVGFVQKDESKAIRPVAWAGDGSDAVPRGSFMWSDESPPGCGPTSTSVRDARSVHLADNHAGPPAPVEDIWARTRTRLGLVSVVAVPIKNARDEVLGVLCVYSTKCDDVTADELQLLEKLTSDLAYGLDALRARTERRHAEEALGESEAKTRSILEHIGIGVALISPQMEILELNGQMREWFPDALVGHGTTCYRWLHDGLLDEPCDFCPARLTSADGQRHEVGARAPRGGVMRDYHIVSSPILSRQGEVTAAIITIDDVSERLSLEAQLQQSQKMEAIGRLAGGVAHDFNNMLGVIIGQADLTLQETDPSEPQYEALQEIRTAAERSAVLTRQLLTFARKQVIAPRILDLNGVVEGMMTMLRRLIGEHIELTWKPADEEPLVKIDPSQIDQILANLCVNARDAIGDNGRVTIETRNSMLDEAFCAEHRPAVPGDYVVLVVSDDGCGMDEATQARLFEPFFTTKDDKGSGLGLATVYGIVNQNNGFIVVSSTPGLQTSFEIYLPRQNGSEDVLEDTASVDIPVAKKGETVLVVEDEESILRLVSRVLEMLGYRVIVASAPSEAVQAARSFDGEVDLIITDVVMPEMNGPSLADKLAEYLPKAKVLFMSGYTRDVLTSSDALGDGTKYLQKPFTSQSLALEVRSILDA